MYFNKTNYFKDRCRIRFWLLAICWIVSITLGYLLAFTLQGTLLSMMDRLVRKPISIVGLAVILFLPIILSVVSIRFSVYGFIYMIAFLKGVCYGFCIYQLLIAYGDAAWMLGALVMFSDSCMLTPLFLFWIRHLDGDKSHLRRDVTVLFFIAIAIGLIDYFAVSPFLFGLTG